MMPSTQAFLMFPLRLKIIRLPTLGQSLPSTPLLHAPLAQSFPKHFALVVNLASCNLKTGQGAVWGNQGRS